MKLKNIYKILTIAAVLATTGCFNPSDDFYYDNSPGNSYTVDRDDSVDRDRTASINDVLTIINIRDFIREKDAYVMYTFSFLTVRNFKCEQQKDQISDNFDYISQKLNELEQDFTNFLQNNYTSNFFNEAQQIREDIEQEIEKLNDNIYECIEESRISGSSLRT